jgi:peptidoglycan/xylan/chitin deacetylase (PgdA/CDA1 family)
MIFSGGKLLGVLIVASLILGFGASRYAATREPEKSPVPVLMYHRVNVDDVAEHYAIPESLFREHMAYLAAHDFVSVLPDDYEAFLEQGKPLPDKPVMLTFDDWSPDHFEVVRPILDEFGFKGVFFVFTNVLSLPRDGERLRVLSDEGHVIAAHSVHHYYLTQTPCDKDWKCCQGFAPCTLEQIRYEIEESKRILEEQTGAPIRSFAWPGNYFSDTTVAMALQAGFSMTFAVGREVLESGVRRNRVGVTRDPSLIFRTEIDGHCGMEYFPKAVETQRCCVASKTRFYRYCVPQL